MGTLSFDGFEARPSFGRPVVVVFSLFCGFLIIELVIFTTKNSFSSPGCHHILHLLLECSEVLD